MARRTTKAVKKTATPRRSKSARFAEEKHIGYETVDWSTVSPDAYESKIHETLRHYGYFYDVKDAYSWATEWVKKNMTKADLKYFKASSDRLFSMTAGGFCRMSMNGATLSLNATNLVQKYINKAIDEGKEKLSTTSKVVNVDTNKKSPADIVKERTSDFIAQIEEHLDTFDTKEFDEGFSVYDELQKGDMPYNTSKAVADYYKPLVNELDELVSKKTADLVEAYSFLGVQKRKRFLKLVSSIVDDAEKYMNSKKAQRKPRAKKATSVTTQVAKIQYLKESGEHKITSINPVNLIGAKEVYLFNVKYNQLTLLVSSSSSGFEVKGTTIQNVDFEGSVRKKLRKPDEFLTVFNKTTKAKKKKMIKELKTKPAAINGRVNDQTLILQVY